MHFEKNSKPVAMHGHSTSLMKKNGTCELRLKRQQLWIEEKIQRPSD